ncbi:MAG: tRNA pseudouridine55 synthase, partial [Acidimicrobiia bacterium]|nr:tRNA pseudouridine55 synthase [Acidimicrobiia bacterium]
MTVTSGLVEGLAVVDKPAGMTSHDVVARARRILGTRKIGHSGTLDPDATGVLLLGVGRVTRLLRFLTALGKTYTAELVLGTETSTLDAAGEVVAVHDMAGVDAGQVMEAAKKFVGEIDQVPPMVSAVKIGGRRLHELARSGIEVDRAARRVTIRRLEIQPTADPLVYRLFVDCSSGTYIRSLAADIGTALSGGAHLRSLRREAVGSFTLAESRPLDDPLLLPPADALRDYPAVDLPADAAATLVRSGRLSLAEPPEGEGPWRVL